MALQDTIDRAQRGNRRDPLLFEPLLDGRGAPPFTALHQRPAQLDDALCNRLRSLARLAPGLGTQTRCPFQIVGPVACFPFIEPTLCTVHVAADRLDFLPGKIPRDSLLSAVFLKVAHHRLLMSLILQPSIYHLFSMSWHNWSR